MRELLRMHELPPASPGVDRGGGDRRHRHDKKAGEGRVRFALLEEVGQPVWGIDLDDELIDLAIGRALAG